MVFSDENNFLRVNDDTGFTLKGDLTAQELNVEGASVMSGSLTTLGELAISGSLRLSDEQALPLGGFLSGSGDSRIHVFETVGTTTESFAAGLTPSFKSIAGEHVIGIRSQVMPYQGTDYTNGADTTKVQAAFGSIGIRPSYNFPNFAFYAETHHGTGDDTSTETNHDKKTEYRISPIEQAQKYKECGFKNLHIVDLDGALTGETVNLDTVSYTHLTLPTNREV